MLFAGPWFLPQDIFEVLCASSDQWQPDQEQAQAFITRRSRSGGGEDLFVRGDDGTARIPVVGMLTKEPSFFFELFGGGSSVYGDIVEAIHTADGDPDIDRIVLEIDSSGGDVEGFFELARAISLTDTRIEAEITDAGLSAAYGLAAVADLVTVNNPLARVGSVGVVTRRFIDDHIVRITSTAAPLKSPEADTPEGVAVIRAELDDIHAEFVTIIAQGRSAALGRSITVEQVNAEFGRGAVVLARNALAAAMIDGIASASTGGAPSPPNPTEPTTGASANMDLATLKVEHRGLYENIRAEALEEGEKNGIAKERDRVTAHVTAGKDCGNLELAAELIADGSEFGLQAVQARYLGAGRNAADAADRRADDAPAAGAGGADAAAAADADKNKADGETIMPEAVVDAVFGGPATS